ncbi:MAG: ion transporter [Candidatus Binatia bacterium]
MPGSGSVASALYEVLAVSPPDDRLSTSIRRLTVGIVLLNTFALALSFLPGFGSVAISVVIVVETVSTAVFAGEYALRLWSAPADPRYRGRLRFALRPLSIVDLLAVVPLFGAPFAASRDSLLHVLRLGWIVRHLKLARILRYRPVLRGAEALVEAPAERLRQIREGLAGAREHDFARVQQQVRAAVRRSVEITRQPRSRATGDSAAGSPAVDATTSSLLGLLDGLEAGLVGAGELRGSGEVVAAAYRESASVFDAAPLTASVEIALEAERVGRKSVPLRDIGRHHFAALAAEADRLSESQEPLYRADVRNELARVRTALTDASSASDSADGDVALNHAIDLLRDVDAPARLAWDTLLFLFEEEHRGRLQLVRTDVERHGHPSFRAGRAWRWLARRLNTTLHARELTIRLWSTVVRHYRETTTSLARSVRLTLLRLGILKPTIREMLLALDEARLDDVRERGLPADYLAHFDVSTPRDDGLWIGFDDELARIRGAIDRWNRRQPTSFIVHGHRGVGKTTLVLQARGLFADAPLTHELLTQKLATVDALVEHLCKRLDLPGGTSGEALADALLAGPRRAILLDDVHHLFFRTIGGLEAVRYLFWLIARTNPHLFWGISLDTSGYKFLAHAMPLGELFHLHVNLDERTSDDLRRLIMARHNRSGASLHYVRDKRNERAFRRRMKALRQQSRGARAHPQEALERVFFDGLTQASAGNVLVATFYWLRSLRIADDDRYHVEPFEPLDLSLIWEFSDDHAFILAALLQHGSLTAAELARILDVDRIAVRLDLEILGNLNVLQVHLPSDTFRVNPVVQRTVCDVLQARHLLA